MAGRLAGEPIDVVVPVRSAEGSEYSKLVTCCLAIRRRIPVNRLIMPSANPNPKTKRRITDLADVPVFDETAIGAGLCRNLGLREVETEYYASIDADTAVRKEWYPLCMNAIHQTNVAASQGYSRPLSRLLDRFVQREALDTGTYADLGNTLLRTEVVRKVGMPVEPMLEDHILYRRVTDGGYLWVVNPALSSDHLLNELDVLWHRYWYGRFDHHGLFYFSRYTAWLVRETISHRIAKYGAELSLFLLLADLSTVTGSLVGHLSRDGRQISAESPRKTHLM